MFERKGVKLKLEPGGGFTMSADCVFLRGKLCSLHGKLTQPRCCDQNKAREQLCLGARAAASGKRWSEVE